MNKSKKNYLKGNNGITLIALVVTIIILIILAGISINLVLGENGIIQKSKNAKELSEEQTAKEKLEIELYSLSINKETGTEYNDEIFDNYLTNKKFIVNGDIVLSDGWQFQVDKTIPKIVASLGRGEEIKDIEVVTNIEYEADYTKAILKIGIMYEGNIVQIKVNGEEIELPNKTESTYQIDNEVLTNGNYNIYIKDENGSYKLVSVSVTDIAEDMSLSNFDDWNKFVKISQNGATFAGKTITLKNNIDLKNIENFTPIPLFEGTFDGNNHTINNMKIVSTSDYVGLFALTNNAKIKNLKLSNANISGYNKVGTAVGAARGSLEIDNVSVDGTISATGWGIGGIVGYAPQTSITIKNSNVNANISTTAVDDSTYLGGLAGLLRTDDLLVSNCYFLGTITITGTNNNWATGGLIGDVGTEAKNDVISTTHLIEKCYVKATITGRGNTGGFVGGITSYQKSGTYNITFNDCFMQGNVTASEYVGGWAPVYQNLGNATVNVKMNRNYCAGKVSSINNNSYGAFIGYNSGTSVSVDYQECYYDKTISGITTTYGDAIGKTTTEMQSSETFANWSTDIWKIEDGKYPILK